MQPLADRIRPRDLNEVVGQGHLLGADGSLSAWLAAGQLPSLLLWGPPGCGKTTLARLLAAAVGLQSVQLSAVLAGVADLRKAITAAQDLRQLTDQGTLLFIDEIHRFSKTQQDALLPHVEAGDVVLCGATTENPGFTVTNALRSRAQVVQLRSLDEQASVALIERALQHSNGLPDMCLTEAAQTLLIRRSAGDGRRLLGYLEAAAVRSAEDGTVDESTMQTVVADAAIDHDRSGDHHYDVASAMIKSIRASHVQAALYWLARFLEGGEDPLFIARRLVISAAEDIGLADPQALVLAQAAMAATQNIGMPEAIYPLSEATIYLATAPKSNSTKSYFRAAQAVRDQPGLGVPVHLRNPANSVMKDAGYGDGYIYDHDAPDSFSGQECLPEALAGTKFYQPGSFGYERDIAKRLSWWQRLQQERQADRNE